MKQSLYSVLSLLGPNPAGILARGLHHRPDPSKYEFAGTIHAGLDGSKCDMI